MFCVGYNLNVGFSTYSCLGTISSCCSTWVHEQKMPSQVREINVCVSYYPSFLLRLISSKISCLIFSLLSPKIKSKIAPQNGVKIQNNIVQPTGLRLRFLAMHMGRRMYKHTIRLITKRIPNVPIFYVLDVVSITFLIDEIIQETIF